MKYAIEIEGLEKEYDHFKLEDFNLKIPSGMIVGLIGENGAGKTTLIKSILNIVQKDKGSIKIFGKDYQEYESEIKEDIGVVLDDMFFPEVLTAKDISMVMKDIYKKWDEDLFYHYLKEFQIKDNQTLKTLSKGMRKKLEIATSLSHHPKLLILDEATSGLDPVVRSEVLEIFMKFLEDEEHTILLSTHITSDLEGIADKIVFVEKGKKLLDMDREKLFNDYGILKCESSDFEKIDKEDIVSYKKNKYNVEVLIKDRKNGKKKYKDFVIDKITLEELMVLMIKGGK